VSPAGSVVVVPLLVVAEAEAVEDVVDVVVGREVVVSAYTEDPGVGVAAAGGDAVLAVVCLENTDEMAAVRHIHEPLDVGLAKADCMLEFVLDFFGLGLKAVAVDLDDIDAVVHHLVRVVVGDIVAAEIGRSLDPNVAAVPASTVEDCLPFGAYSSYHLLAVEYCHSHREAVPLEALALQVDPRMVGAGERHIDLVSAMLEQKLLSRPLDLDHLGQNP